MCALAGFFLGFWSLMRHRTIFCGEYGHFYSEKWIPDTSEGCWCHFCVFWRTHSYREIQNPRMLISVDILKFWTGLNYPHSTLSESVLILFFASDWSEKLIFKNNCLRLSERPNNDLGPISNFKVAGFCSFCVSWGFSACWI